MQQFGDVNGMQAHAVIESKDMLPSITFYFTIFTYIYLYTLCSNTFAHLKIGRSDTKGFVFQVFNTSRCKYQEIKA